MSSQLASAEVSDAEKPSADLPVMQPGDGFSFLRGVRVLDLTTSIAGPYAGMLLGDFGADVVKLENHAGGDDARAWGPPFLDGESLWFLSVNRNKRSVALDFQSREGAALIAALMTKADVVLVNQTPRVLAKLAIGPDAAQKLRPDVIYAAITGFGLSGPRADWTCYDLIAEGYSGIMDLTGEAGREAQKVGAPAADMLAGQDAAMAVIAALFDRSRTGKGRVIDVALVDSMTRFLTCRLVSYLGSGELPRRSGGRDSVIAIYQTFETADLPITLGLGNDNLWRRFWEAVGDSAPITDPDYQTNQQRREHRDAIVAKMQAILKTLPRAEWLTRFAAARVPAGPINRLDEVARDIELQRRGLLYRLASGDGYVPQVGTGLRIDGQANTPRRAPPRHGADTRDVISEWLGREP